MFIALLGQSHHVEELHGALFRLAAGEPQDLDEPLHAVSERGHVGKQVEVLKAHPDLASNAPDVLRVRGQELSVALHVGERLSVDVDDAAVDGFQGHQHAEHGRLSGAGRADDGHHFSGRDVEVELVQDDERPVTLGHVPKPHHRDVVALEAQRISTHVFGHFTIPSVRRTHFSNRLIR